MKTYNVVIKGNTDEKILREILSDDFELISLTSETSEPTREEKLVATRNAIITFLTTKVTLADVNTALNVQLDRELCNEVLKEFRDTVECLNADVKECTDCDCEEVKDPCTECGKANAKYVHEEEKFCDLLCVHKYLH